MAGMFDIFFEVKANVTEAVAGFSKINGEMTKMQKNGEFASTSMLKMEKSSRMAGIALVGIGGAFAAVAGVSIKAAINVQGAQAKLSTAVKDTGVSFAAFTPYMNTAVDSMAKLNFTAGDTMTALASMTAATRSPQRALDMLQATADLAAFKQESLAQAADTVSRAAMGQARGLGDLGVALGKTIAKGATVAQIMQAIADRTHGAAKAAAEADPWKQLTVQFGLMEEKLGTALLPAFKKLSDWVINIGIPALEEMGKWIGDNKGLFTGFVATLGVIWAAPKIAAVINSISLITKAYSALRDVLMATALFSSITSGGVTAVAVLAAFAGVAAYGVYANYKNIQNENNGVPNAPYIPGTTSGTPKAGILGVPVLPMLKNQKTGLNSGIDISKVIASNAAKKKATAKKPSIKQQMKGTTDLGTGVNVNVWVDGAKSAAKVATQGAPLTGGR